MKYKVLAGIAVLCLMLSGCSAWLDGSYYSVTPHLEQRSGEEEEIIHVADYEELCNALTKMIDTRAGSGVISMADYPANLRFVDMQRAIDYAKNTYPMGAYSVSRIRQESGTKAGKPAFAISIEYGRLPSEMEQVQPVLGMEGAKAATYSALNQCSSSITMKVIHFTDTDFSQIVEDYAATHPEMVMETPQVTVSCYPEYGATRIVELKFTYLTSRDSLRMMQTQVEPLFTSAKAYVSGDAGEHQKFMQMYSFLMKRYDYKIETSITPAYSLLQHGVGDSKAFASVYASMCRSADLTCTMVTGTRNGEPWTWNIVKDGDEHYHVDLLRCLQEGWFHEMSDDEMDGYVWDYSAYPACERAQDIQPEEPGVEDGSVAPTVPEETEESSENTGETGENETETAVTENS